MLGYTEKDIQEFGNCLTWAIDTAKSQGDEKKYVASKLNLVDLAGS